MVTAYVGCEEVEVYVQDSSGVAFPHIFHGDKNYCVASPGATFELRIQRFPGNAVGETFDMVGQDPTGLSATNLSPLQCYVT